jgi:type I restriction-modification system DNA methylase subunit
MDYRTSFQTPPEVCQYMARMIPAGVRTVLEPTPGVGNLVRALNGYDVTAPEDFFRMGKERFDCVVTNPPFAAKYAFGVPGDLPVKGMQLGYYILKQCLNMSDNVIALMPWFTISDSDVRLRALKRWGLISVTALPRKTFEYARIQTVVLQLQKGYKGATEFKVYDLINEPIKKDLFSEIET